MKARIKWVENALMIGEPGSGHAKHQTRPPSGVNTAVSRNSPITATTGINVTTIKIDNRQGQALDLVITTQRPKGTAKNNDKDQGQQKQRQHLSAVPDQDLQVFESNTQ